MELLTRVHPEWREVLLPYETSIARIEKYLATREIVPNINQVFRALESPRRQVKVLILGQDPYPNPEFACGLAFSIPPNISRLPGSLINIKKELLTDVGTTQIGSGDLSPWVDQGVMLLNRILSADAQESNSHKNIGWEAITEHIIRTLSADGCIAILWGKAAQSLSHHFPESQRILGAHPSPLSAYRGFFGSKPFTRANELLRKSGKSEIIW